MSTGGDVGYMVERNRITFRDASGELKTQYGKAVTVWRKQVDGAWKCVIDTWNTSPVERVLPAAGRLPDFVLRTWCRDAYVRSNH